MEKTFRIFAANINYKATMKKETTLRATVMLLCMLFSLTTAFAEVNDAEEARLHTIVFKYFDGMDDDAFYGAMNTYRNYVEKKG